MKYKCNFCGKIIINPLHYIIKGTQYTFCDERCDDRYTAWQREAEFMLNPFCGVIVAFYMIKNFLFRKKEKK